jgi:3-phosphoglycerate kinase
MKTLKDFSAQGGPASGWENKKVLVRCDFNVPLSETGEILDDFRIIQALPTIKFLIKQNARIVLISHLGEANGKIVEKLKLDNVAKKLSELLGLLVLKTDDCVGEDVEKQIENLKNSEVMLLENLRFHKEEEENNLEFARQLSLLCDIYVNEAFSVCHREHASLVGITEFLPSCVGFLFEKEIVNLDKVLKNPKKPMTVIIGGKKIETKSKFINKISEIADYVLVGDLIKKEIIDKNIQLTYPEKIFSAVDHLEDPSIEKDTIKMFKDKILKSKTIIWNGPLSKTEDKEYAKGTLDIAKAIVESKAFSVIGGGETVEFIKTHGMMDQFSHVSTGGGAMISYLSGEKLPGITALNKG